MKTKYSVFLFFVSNLIFTFLSLNSLAEPNRCVGFYSDSTVVDWSALTKLYEEKMAKAKVPALQIELNENGKRIYSASLGLANCNPCTPSTRFYSASMTKMLTASALFQLNEQGIVNLNDPLVKYLPWLNLHLSKQMERVTIAQVLSHESGMSRNGLEFWTNPEKWNSVPTETELKRAVLQQTFGTQEGLQLKYSNTGFELLGHLIGTVCTRCRGQNPTERYASYVKENILDRLNMKSSGFTPTPAQLEQFATPHGLVDANGTRPAYPVLPGSGASVGAWGLFSTAKDFILFMEEIKKAALSQENRLFNKPVADYITKPVAWDLLNPGIGHSLGFRVIKTDKGLLVGHTGTFPGYSSAGFVSLHDGTVGVVYLNTIDAGGLGYLMEAFKAKSGQVLAPEPPKFPQIKVLPPAMPENPFAQIVGKYGTIYGTYDVVFESNIYFIVQSGQKSPLYINYSPDGKTIEGRVGTNLGYFDYIGDGIKFNLNDQGKVERAVVANAIVAKPLPRPTVNVP